MDSDADDPNLTELLRSYIEKSAPEINEVKINPDFFGAFEGFGPSLMEGASYVNTSLPVEIDGLPSEPTVCAKRILEAQN